MGDASNPSAQALRAVGNRANAHQPETDLQIEIVTGNAADRLLGDEGFIRQWQDLHAACPWGTVLQSAPFARAWYTTYRPLYEPVLVLGHGVDGGLSGLLAAGYAPRRGLVMAGAQQAEYQTWLATAEQGNAFATAAFYALGRRYPSSPLTLKYLPPDTPLDWLNGESPVARYCVLTATPRPMMDLRNTQAIDKCLKKRNIRSRLNKLREEGYAGMERITDPTEMARHFDEIIAWHDFRRVTVSGSGPFENDPYKKPFHFQMLREGVLCATVLKIQDRVVSMQLDMLGKKVVHLALGAYAPWLSKFALGKIHILEVAKILRAEGIEWMDLTPGDDPYKSEFATRWEDVHTLTVSPGAAGHWKVRLAQRFDSAARGALRRIGSDPVAAKIAARGLFSRPLATLTTPLRNLRGRLNQSAATIDAYAISAAALRRADVSKMAGEEVHFDSVENWLTYHPSGFEAARHACLSDATRRFAAGMQSYTMMDNGRLRFSCWLSQSPAEALAEHGLNEPASGETVAVLLDVRTYGGDPTAVLADALTKSARDAADRLGADRVVVMVARGDRNTIAALEQIGFGRDEPADRSEESSSSRAAAAMHLLTMLASFCVSF